MSAWRFMGREARRQAVAECAGRLDASQIAKRYGAPVGSVEWLLEQIGIPAGSPAPAGEAGAQAPEQAEQESPLRERAPPSDSRPATSGTVASVPDTSPLVPPPEAPAPPDAAPPPSPPASAPSPADAIRHPEATPPAAPAIAASRAPLPPRLAAIAQDVGSRHQVAVEVILGGGRSKRIDAARVELMYRLYEAGVRPSAIGAILGRDHSTVRVNLVAYARRHDLPFDAESEAGELLDGDERSFRTSSADACDELLDRLIRVHKHPSLVHGIGR